MIGDIPRSDFTDHRMMVFGRVGDEWPTGDAPGLSHGLEMDESSPERFTLVDSLI